MRTGRAGLGLVLVAGCSAPTTATAPEGPSLEGLGTYRRVVTTSSPLAQRWFDRGLALLYGFHHDEAMCCFDAALQHDEGCAMAWWGKALATGPNINDPVLDGERARQSHTAARMAAALAGQASRVEAALIGALAARYPDGEVGDQAARNEAYAEAMRAVWRAHGTDAEAGVALADALLNVRPWDQWTKEGRPQPGTEEAIAALETVLERAPDHVGANHLYIHALEAGPHPERALAAADRLRTLVTGTGHLVHMPAHVYARVGRWADASTANEAAAAVDRRWLATRPQTSPYRFYFAHNLHFLAYTSMMEGRRAAALAAAEELITLAPPPDSKAMAGLFDGMLLARLHVLVRFGDWDAILDHPDPGGDWPITRANWRFARGVALAALGKVDEAAREAEAFEVACTAVPGEAVVILNAARDVLEVARHLLRGEILFRQGQTDEAFAALRRAVAAEMALRYDEPPGWMEPVRQALGALLLESGQVQEALAVYREDLARNPNNGWSLMGIAECLRRTGAPKEELAAAERDLEAAWRRADVPPRASCACRRL